MDLYLGRIFEAFEKSTEILWNKFPMHWKGHFKVQDTEYEIFAKNYSTKGQWLFKFTGNGSFDLIGDYKKAFIVLPTIEKAINELFIEKDPEVFIFLTVDDSRGRKNLYERFCKKIQAERNLNYQTEEYGDTKFYLLTKHEYDGMELNNTLSRIRKDYGIK